MLRTPSTFPANSEIFEAAGERFEPSLTYPELGSPRSWLLLVVSKTDAPIFKLGQL